MSLCGYAPRCTHRMLGAEMRMTWSHAQWIFWVTMDWFSGAEIQSELGDCFQIGPTQVGRFRILVIRLSKSIIIYLPIYLFDVYIYIYHLMLSFEHRASAAQVRVKLVGFRPFNLHPVVLIHSHMGFVWTSGTPFHPVAQKLMLYVPDHKWGWNVPIWKIRPSNANSRWLSD